MKHIIILAFLFIFSNCNSQENKLIVNKRLVSDLSETISLYEMKKEVNGITKWKENFKYINSIEIYEIIYLSDGLKIKGFLVKPKKKGNYPCIIYNRGGNRNFGVLTSDLAAIRLGKIAKEGYVVIASQYRGNGGSEGNEEFGGKDVNDITILPDVLKEIEDADINRIGMYGWSRGGMMTYIALTKTDKIKAAIVGGAPSNLTIIDRPKMETKVYSELIPNYWSNKEKELKKRSAIYFIDKFPKNLPILMLHGTADWRVKSEQSLNLALAFGKKEIPYRLIMFEGGDHGISEHRKEVNEQILKWFNKYLKDGKKLPNTKYHGG